ncbi:MAG: winged helix-turn-helix domain-containing protein [Hyphomicrobiaceae bacterium]|nr:winged helix-turn-helix domain-containing protein [Hyphomicrobiaceae bacterium]
MIYRFGDFELDKAAYELRQDGRVCHTEPLVFDLIAFLLQTNGRVVSRDEIVEHVWKGRFVSDATVSSGIKAARQVLGDSGAEQCYIRTVRGRGVQFVAAVKTSGGISPSASAPAQPQPENADRNTELGIAANRPSIAVLPIRLLTSTEQFGSLGDAISHEVIVELARLHWLHVINRGSSFAFRDASTDLESISQVLGARFIVSGTLALYGGNSVVTVELTQVESRRIVWADRFEQPVSDLLALKSTIAAHIVGAIESRIQMAEAIAAGRIPTGNLDAWSAYHRGLWHMFRFTHSDNTAASSYFNRALQGDPGFARAHAALSFTHFQNAFLNFSDDRKSELMLTRKHAETALAHDPFDPFVNLTMGRASWIAGDLDGAIPWLERSIELSPNYAFANYNRALIGVLQGDGEASANQIDKAIALSPIDPLSYAMLSTRALSHMVIGDYEAAQIWAARAIKIPNAHFHIFVIAAIAYECAGHRGEAMKCIARLRALHPGFEVKEFFRAFPFQAAGFREIAERALNQLGLN